MFLARRNTKQDNKAKVSVILSLFYLDKICSISSLIKVERFVKGQQLSSDSKSPGLILSGGSSNKPGMGEPNRVMYGGMFTALAVTQLP